MNGPADYAKRFIDDWPSDLEGLDLAPSELFVSIRLHRLSRLLENLDERSIRPFEANGIKTSDDVRVLSLLRRAGERGLTNSDLLAEIGGSKAGMSSRLERLTKHGLLERSSAAADRRFQTNKLTTEGRTIADRALTAMFNRRKPLFQRLGDEQLFVLATALADIIQEVAPDD